MAIVGGHRTGSRRAALREALTGPQLAAFLPAVMLGAYWFGGEGVFFARLRGPGRVWIQSLPFSRLAGRIAEGYISTSGKATELYTEKLLPAVSEGLQKAGRPDDAISRMIEMKVSFDTDRARAMEDTKIWAALALSGEQKMGVEDPREMERLARTVEDVAHRRWLVSDDVDEHIEQIRPYIEWGFDHLVFHFPGDDQERAMALYAERVLPELRARFG